MITDTVSMIFIIIRQIQALTGSCGQGTGYVFTLLFCKMFPLIFSVKSGGGEI